MKQCVWDSPQNNQGEVGWLGLNASVDKVGERQDEWGEMEKGKRWGGRN